MLDFIKSFNPLNLKNLRLVDDAHKLWTFSSVKLACVGAAFAIAAPLLQVWQALPDSMTQYLPETFKASVPLVIIFAAIIMARATTTKPVVASDSEQTQNGVPNAPNLS